MEQHIKNIQKFADKFNLTFTQEGECGFGRECVGLLVGNNYVDYNPHDSVNYDPIEGFYDERFYEIAPKNAYRKHNCLAVLGRGEDAIRQLSEWVYDLKKLNVTVEKYKTGATGSGEYNYAVKINKL